MTPQTPQNDYEKYVKIADGLIKPITGSVLLTEQLALAQVAATLALAAAVRSLARGEEK